MGLFRRKENEQKLDAMIALMQKMVILEEANRQEIMTLKRASMQQNGTSELKREKRQLQQKMTIPTFNGQDGLSTLGKAEKANIFHQKKSLMRILQIFLKLFLPLKKRKRAK